jgi:hypothetical protein
MTLGTKYRGLADVVDKRVEKRNVSRQAYAKWGKFPLPVSYGYSSPHPKEACFKRGPIVLERISEGGVLEAI